MSNIKNNNYRKIDCRLVKDNYFDFMISKHSKKCKISKTGITLDI